MAGSQIPLFKVYSAPGSSAALGRVLRSGYIGQGPRVDDFEAALAEFWGVRGARGLPPDLPASPGLTASARPATSPRTSPSPVVTVNSGTSALDLAYHLAGVTRGTRVLTSPLTCTATNLPLLHRGAAIEWYDCDPLTGSAAPADLIRRVNAGGEGETVVVLVSWAGGNLAQLLAELRSGWHHSVKVIVDYAHAAPLPPPLLADYTCYSFQAIKHLTTGDGGALVCASPQDTARARLLRWYGLDRTSSADFRCSQDITDPGFKYHMNDLQAALGLENLKTLQVRYLEHAMNAKYLNAHLPSWATPFTLTGSAFWTCPVLLHPDVDREALTAHLGARGISAGRIHRRNDTHPCFAPAHKEDLSGVTLFDEKHLSLPCGWWVTRSGLSRIKNALKDFKP